MFNRDEPFYQPLELTLKTYWDGLNRSDSNVLNVVYFGRETCGPCVRTTPEYYKTIDYFQKMWYNIAFWFVDTDIVDSNYLLEDVGVKGVPSFLYYKNSNEVFRSDGFHFEWQITDEIFDILRGVYEG
ncbi:MAG: thioredoxin family protein [Betaproteobacteria bacterium]|jgi:thiol-disulfide isomerase/thioredoxin